MQPWKFKGVCVNINSFEDSHIFCYVIFLCSKDWLNDSRRIDQLNWRIASLICPCMASKANLEKLDEAMINRKMFLMLHSILIYCSVLIVLIFKLLFMICVLTDFEKLAPVWCGVGSDQALRIWTQTVKIGLICCIIIFDFT